MVRQSTRDEAAAAGVAAEPTGERTLICGIDRPESVEAVASVGSQLADRLGLRLVLAHVVRGPRARPPWSRQPPGPRGRDAAARARELLDSVGPADGVERRILHGEPRRALQELADEEGGACLVIGSRARGPLMSRLPGSTSRALARRGALPVVVVPSGALTPDGHDGGCAPRAVVCGAEASERGDDTAAVACDLAVRADLDLVLTHVSGRPLAAMRPFRTRSGDPAEREIDGSPKEAGAVRRLVARADRLARHGARAKVRLEAGSAARGIDHAARAEDALLIVMGATRRGPLSVLLEPAARRLAAAASRPVMLVPADARLGLGGGADGIGRPIRHELA